MKISIIGLSGSGKSTLCKALSMKYNIKPLYMDTIHWLPNWVEKDFDLEKQEFDDYLDSNNEWIIDGNYFKLSLERRLDESDKIIFFRFNRFACLHRAIKRKNKYKHKSRESMTPGCDEKIDWSFFIWILLLGRTRKRMQRYKDICNKYHDKVVIIRNQRELNKFYHEEGISPIL